ncbi:hypothetical protein M407DRAFT_29009 [Tulasnella calospora MUT 4182]|uniref:Uncharacterized protein n=1 Tax=Tulasnella calospora MUT 4182 TaxID=1051891 RepID=A0A0C3KIZ4_9AGAM|nr:hypothetical protein M407DRAFT_29009 [Tulasnella calospora MUT 4182]
MGVIPATHGRKGKVQTPPPQSATSGAVADHETRNPLLVPSRRYVITPGTLVLPPPGEPG